MLNSTSTTNCTYGGKTTYDGDDPKSHTETWNFSTSTCDTITPMANLEIINFGILFGVWIIIFGVIIWLIKQLT